MRPFVIPRMTLPTKQREKFIEPIPRIPVCQRQERLYHRVIPFGVGLIVVNRPTEVNCPTGSPEAQPMTLPDEVYQFPLLRRP